jgi:hypothetical protein
MYEIIPTTTLQILSIYELAILLLSAYCHDIGMTPEYKKVKKHYDCLLFGNGKKYLTLEELKDFQKWLDDQNENAEIPLTTNGKADRETLGRAQKLITYYARSKHNEWSEDWMRKKLKQDFGRIKALYPSFLDDLIDVCKSHHEGLIELEKSKFDPVPVESAVVHKRYLAMCLRVADVMENDAERTPEVIFNHRDIEQSSVTYWEKDAPLNLTLKDYKVSAFARLEKAYLEKAVRETVQDIEDQLRLCTTLKERRDLSIFPPYNNLKHEWRLIPDIHKNIGPKEGTYEFIDGAFRPNTKKILELLSGTALYGSEMLAIRELLQNAFDATKEKIAYERLKKDEPANPKWEKILGDLHTVTLTLSQEGDEVWLTCKDEGLGMSKEILNNYFLVSGASKRHQVRELERKCVDKGFVLERTGKFGIGVLSYFMIADKIDIKTRRSLMSGDSDNQTWAFEISGLNDFGELKRISESDFEGTEIRVRLRRDIVVNGIEEFVKQVDSMLSNIVHAVPCTFACRLGNILKRDVQAGWTVGVESFKQKIEGEFQELLEKKFQDNQFNYSLFSTDEKRRWDMINARKKPTIDRMLDSLKLEVIEGAIGDKIKYRVVVPYYEIDGEYSLVYLCSQKQLDGKIGLGQLGNRVISFMPKVAVSYSYKGMSVDISPTNPEYIHIDIIDGELSQISISRNSIERNASLILLENQVKQIEYEWKEAFIANRVALYKSENYVKHINAITTPPVFKWPQFVDGKFHIHTFSGKFLIGLTTYKLRHEYNANVPVLEPVEETGDVFSDVYKMAIGCCKLKPLRVIISNEIFLEFDTTVIDNGRNETIMFCEFPSNWEECIGVFTYNRFVLNKQNPIVVEVDHNELEDLFFNLKNNGRNYIIDNSFSQSKPDFAKYFLAVCMKKIASVDELDKVLEGFISIVGGQKKMTALLDKFLPGVSHVYILGSIKSYKMDFLSLTIETKFNYNALPKPEEEWLLNYKYDNYFHNPWAAIRISDV